MGGVNPYATILSGGTPPPTPEVSTASAGGVNPYATTLAAAAPGKHREGFFEQLYDPLKPVVQHTAHAAGTGINKVFDVLNRPDEATTTFASSILRHEPFRKAAGDAWQTFLHSQTPQQYQANTAEIAQHMMGATPDQYNALPGWRRFANEFATQLITDPTTYLFGAGLAEHVGELTMSRALPKFMQGVSAMSASANPTVKSLGIGVQRAFDAMHYKGDKAREIMQSMGGPGNQKQWEARFKQLTAGGMDAQVARQQTDREMAGSFYYLRHQKMINNARMIQNLDLIREFEPKFNAIYADLSRDEEKALNMAIHSGKMAGVDPKIAAKAEQYDQLTNSLAYLEGTPELREKLTKGSAETGKPFELPEQYHRFAFETGADGRPDLTKPIFRNLMKPEDYLREYLPTVRDVARFRKAATYGEDVEGIARLDPNVMPTTPEDEELLKQDRDRGPFNIPGVPPNPYTRALQEGLSKTPSDLEVNVGKILGTGVREGERVPGPFTPVEPTGEGMAETLQHPEAPNEPRTEQMINKRDPYLSEREGDVSPVLEPELQRKVMESRVRRFAGAVSAADAEMKMNRLFGVNTWTKIPLPNREYFRETLREPSGWDFWKSLIDVPKIGLFALPFRHMMNIGTLLALADPGAYPGAIVNHIKLMWAGQDAVKRARVLGKAYQYGVSGVPSMDREAAGWIGKRLTGEGVSTGLQKTAAVLKAGMDPVKRQAALADSYTAGWLGRMPFIGDLYKASNHMLWAFDDAAKASRFQRLLTQYMKMGMEESDAAARAADQTAAELIDYANRSAFTQSLAYIAPFATYRTAMPKAVGRALATKPHHMLAMGRLSPEMTGDVQQGPVDPITGKQKVGKSYLPTADVMRGLANPMEYARATAGWPAQLGIATGIENPISYAKGEPPQPYFTYGKPMDPEGAAKYALNSTVGSFPFGQAGLNRAGLGIWGSAVPTPGQTGAGPLTDVSGALRQQFGFGLTAAPSPRQIYAANHIAALQRAVEVARHSGNALAVAAAEKRLRDFEFYHRTYVP